jgi:molybdenum cofactor cytidylyltransferase
LIWAVVLAAGESRRMGRPKLLLPYGSATIIETVVRNVTASRVDRTLVVLGARREEVEEKIRNFAAKKVFNREFRNGMFSSVLCGLGSLPRSARAAVLVLADQPGIPAEVIDSLIDSFLREKKGLVIPVFRRRPEDILEVRVSSPEILRDIDSPRDYRKSRRGRAKGEA